MSPFPCSWERVSCHAFLFFNIVQDDSIFAIKEYLEAMNLITAVLCRDDCKFPSNYVPSDRPSSKRCSKRSNSHKYDAGTNILSLSLRHLLILSFPVCSCKIHISVQSGMSGDQISTPSFVVKTILSETTEYCCFKTPT